MRTIAIVMAAALATAPLAGCEDGSAEGTILTAQQGGAVPFEKSYRLRRAERVDPEALMTLLGIPAENYAAASFDAGIGAVVVTGLETEADGFLATATRAEIYAPDMDAIAALKSDEPTNGLVRPFDRVRFFDLVLEGAATEGGWNDDEGERMALRVSAAGLELVALRLSDVGGLSDAGGGPPPAADEEAEDGKEAARVLGSFAFESFDLYGFDMGMETGVEGQEDAVDIQLSAAKLSIEGWKDGTLGRVVGSELDYATTGQSAGVVEQLAAASPQLAMLADSPLAPLFFPDSTRSTVRSFAWDGLSVAGLLPYMERGEKPPLTATDLIRIGGMDVRDQTTYVNGKSAGTVERMTVSAVPFQHYMPLRLTVESRGGVTDYTAYLTDDQVELAALLRQRGLDEVRGQSRLDYAYDPKAGTISLTSESDAKDFFGSDFVLDLDSFDYEGIMSGDDAAPKTIVLDGMTLTLTDEKLLDSAFAVYGALAGQDPATLRQQAVGLVTLGALQGGQISPRVPGYAAALSSFLSKGGTLKIAIEPERTVTFGDLAVAGETEPAAALDLMNLVVTHSD